MLRLVTQPEFFIAVGRLLAAAVTAPAIGDDARIILPYRTSKKIRYKINDDNCEYLISYILYLVACGGSKPPPYSIMPIWAYFPNSWLRL